MNHTMVLILSIVGGATFGSLISAMLYLALEPVATKTRSVFRRFQDAWEARKEVKS